MDSLFGIWKRLMVIAEELHGHWADRDPEECLGATPRADLVRARTLVSLGAELLLLERDRIEAAGRASNTACPDPASSGF